MGQQQNSQAIHWSDGTADRLIRQLGDKDKYVVASGITPSGTVHFGNFREVITVDLVARALRARGKNVRFIFSWDDYDTFRKIPKDMPKQEVLEKYMYNPIVDTPDPFDKEESYAAHQENLFEGQLSKVGVVLEPLYQAKKYRAGEYDESIIKTLKNRDTIVAVLNEHRKEPLPDTWMPVSIYCENCKRDDKTKNIKFDGDKTLTYSCEHCSHEGTEVIDKSPRIKLPWRMDWPMRWAHEVVDFEPGGKDHSSQGGSFTTSKEIVGKVYGGQPPLYLQYEFVGIKGTGGKMSSSAGGVLTINDVLEVYEPEMIRWIFASYKSNVEFSVSFDLDVIKTYEDFDRQERLAYGVEEGNAKKVAMAKRVLELSQLTEGPLEDKMPLQPSFRHLCNMLQIHDGSIEKAREEYADQIITARDERRFKERSQCALNWLSKYAPEDFKFNINKTKPTYDFPAAHNDFFAKLKETVENEWDNYQTDKDLNQKIYDIIHEFELEPKEVFVSLYQLMINQDKGPKLAGFIHTIGKEKMIQLLN